jgi:hypothetical protein
MISIRATDEHLYRVARVMQNIISTVCPLRTEPFPKDQVWQMSRYSERDQHALHLLERIPYLLNSKDPASRDEAHQMLGFVQAHMLFRGMVGNFSDFEDELDHKLREMEGGSDDQG